MHTDILLQIALCDSQVYRQLTKVNKSIYTLASSKYGIHLRNEKFATVTNEVVYIGGRITMHKLFGKLHRDDDLPAEIYADGTQRWYQHGKIHRDNDLPAEIYANGTQRWFQHGKVHRSPTGIVPLVMTGALMNDRPAAVHADGAQRWFQHGNLHRDNDQPAEICANGSLYWYRHGNLHRDGDQPAVILANGSRSWYKNGNFITSLRSVDGRSDGR